VAKTFHRPVGRPASSPWCPEERIAIGHVKNHAASSRTSELHFSCIQSLQKSLKVTKKVALAMATHFWPREALH